MWRLDDPTAQSRAAMTPIVHLPDRARRVRLESLAHVVQLVAPLRYRPIPSCDPSRSRSLASRPQTVLA